MRKPRSNSFVALTLAVLIQLAQVAAASAPVAAAGEKPVLFFFWGEGCPHCARAKPFLDGLKRRHPSLEVRSFEVFGDERNRQLLMEMARRHGTMARGVPMFFIGGRYFSGFSEETGRRIEAEVARARGEPMVPSDQDRLQLPFLGTVDSSSLSLPIFTVVIAGLDSFNPCAFFVLLFLLSLLVHAHSRKRMLIIGGIFVLFSGLIYFIYMAAWLNLFLLLGGVAMATMLAGIVALVIAVINIKDFFFFRQGISLAIPEQAKPRLFERMRKVVQAGSSGGMIAAAIVLAVAANTYEIFCTAGFPMIYTRALTLQNLPAGVFYLYLALYNVVYVIPLACIVLLFVITLGSRKLSEWQGRVLKLLSGVMMLGLAIVLLVKPALMNNVVMSIGLLLASLLVTGVVALATKRHASGMDRAGGQRQ